MNIMCVERRRDHRRRSLPGPHSFVSKDTPKAQCVKFYGIPEGKEQYDDIPEIRKYEVCI